MAAVLCGLGRNGECVTAVDRLLGDASHRLDPSMHGSLLVARSVGDYHQGRFVDADRGFRTARDLLSTAERSDGDRLGGADILVAAASYGSLTLMVLGRLEAARASALVAEARARELGDPFSLAWALFGCARAYVSLGEVESALAAAEETITLSRQHGFSAFTARGLEFRGKARAGLGDASMGIEDCRQALALWGRSGVVHTTPNIAADLADLLVRTNRCEEARRVLDDVDALVAGTDEAAARAECQRVRGLIALDEGDSSEATRWLAQAMATAQSQAARLYALRAGTALADVLARQGRTREAHRVLTDAYGWFTEGHRAPDLQRARAGLDRLTE
jgi:ATP/maltotriose-dependent transcriptional regulator MalT